MRGAENTAAAGAGGLFAYGTLRFPAVLSALLHRVPQARPAAVAGWRAARLRGVDYPGLVPGDGEVSGVLLSGLSAAEWRVIDDYEADEYNLVPVVLTDGALARTYRYERLDRVLPENWSADDFAARLPEFSRACRSWRAEYQF